MDKAGFPFIALGLAFVALGVSSNRIFLVLGLPFIALGLTAILRGRRR